MHSIIGSNWNFQKGLIVFVLDQSQFMNEEYNKYTTRMDVAAGFINSFILELIARCSSWRSNNEFYIRSCAHVVVIGYGGKYSDGVQILLNSRIDEIAIDACEGRYGNQVCLLDIIERKECNNTFVVPQANGYNDPIIAALELCCEYLESWRDFANEDFYIATPVLVNIGCGKIFNVMSDLHVKNKLVEIKKRMDDIILPDGKAMIYNIVLDKEGVPNVFPCQAPRSEEERYLFNLSSEMPKVLTNFYNYQLANVCKDRTNTQSFIENDCFKGNEKLFISNLSVDKLKAFGYSLIDFHMHEWGGMYVGHPNDLLEEW